MTHSLFDQLLDGILNDARALTEQISALPLPERIDALNAIRSMLHTVSPFKDDPVDLVLWVRGEQVHVNDYNPNAMAPPETRLLKISIDHDGFTQPVVTWVNGKNKREVVDGEQRTRVGKKFHSKRLYGYLPVTTVKDKSNGRDNRMAATIRHNRARGVHGVLPMTDIVAELIRLGWSDDEVALQLGMDADEVLRFKQNKGLPELFKDREYSRAWE